MILSVRPRRLPHRASLAVAASLVFLAGTSLALPSLFASNIAAAQESPGIAIAQRYLTAHTVAGVRLDLDRVDLNTLRRRGQELGILEPDADRQLLQAMTMAQATVSSFALTGGEELWVLIDPRDPQRGVLFVMTIKAGPDQAETARQLARTLDLLVPEPSRNGMRILAKQDHIVMGSEQLIAAAEIDSGRKLPPVLGQDRGQAVTLFAIPSDDHRRAMAETIGDLPAPFRNIDLSEIADRSRYAWLDLSIAPALGIKGVVSAADPASAAVVAEELNAAIDSIGGVEELSAQFPGVVEALTMVRWEVDGDTATLEIGEEKGNFAPMLETLAESIRRMRQAASRSVSMNNQKQILLSLHTFYDTFKRFPADIVSPDGRPLLSWRVEILPFIEQQALYQAFRLDEPWDSEHNKPLSDMAIQVFRGMDADEQPHNHTNYLRAIGEGTLFGPKGATDFKHVTDGTSNTIALLEVDAEHSVPWAKPADLNVDLQAPFAGLYFERDVTIVSLLDGSVRAISKTIGNRTMVRLLQHADGQPVQID